MQRRRRHGIIDTKLSLEVGKCHIDNAPTRENYVEDEVVIKPNQSRHRYIAYGSNVEKKMMSQQIAKKDASRRPPRLPV